MEKTITSLEAAVFMILTAWTFFWIGRAYELWQNHKEETKRMDELENKQP